MTALSLTFAPKHPESQGSRLLRIVKVRDAIKDGRSQIEERQMIDAEGVARLWLDLATADPTELTQNVHAPCRYCYGIDGEYQWRTSVISALPKVRFGPFMSNRLRVNQDSCHLNALKCCDMGQLLFWGSCGAA